jgi:MFS family permease
LAPDRQGEGGAEGAGPQAGRSPARSEPKASEVLAAARSEAQASEVVGLAANVPKVLALNAAFMFIVVMPVIVPFFRAHGLTLAQVYGLQALFAAATLLLELPSGYVADVLGRRRALVLASVAKGVAFAVLAFADDFAGFAAFELLAAVAVSLFSGADVALLYETYEHVPHAPDAPRRAIGGKLFWSQLGETGAALLAGALVVASLELPIQVNAIAAWAPLPIALSLVDPPGARMPRGRHGDNARRVARTLFGADPFLRWLVANQVLFGAATLLAVWAFQPAWEALGIGLGAFGALWALHNLAVAATARVAHRFEAALGFAATAALVAALPAAGYLVTGAALARGGVAVGVAAGLAFAVCRGLNGVLIRDAINVRVPSEMRATANSVGSLGMRLVFALVGPAVGRGMDVHGVGPTLLVLGVAFAAAGGLVCAPLLRAARRAARPPWQAIEP